MEIAIKSKTNEIAIPIKTECFLIIFLTSGFVRMIMCRVAMTDNTYIYAPKHKEFLLITKGIGLRILLSSLRKAKVAVFISSGPGSLKDSLYGSIYPWSHEVIVQWS